MSSPNKTVELVCGNEPLYLGWEDYYRSGDEKSAWGNDAPPFLAERLIQYLPPKAKVVDFGAGDARNSLPLGAAGHPLTLVDISAAGLERARRRAIELGLQTLPTLVTASLDQLPLASEQFEFALCIDALPQVYRPQQALKEMARTLVHGGRLLVNVFTPADCAYGEGERLNGRSFLFKNTLFSFFEDAEFKPLLSGLFTVCDCQQVSWQDPPHPPFRPYPHTHDALVYVLQKI